MTETMQIYVKNTSNCGGMELQTFELLSPTWTGDKIRLLFGAHHFDVVGWTDLFGGSACGVNVAKVRAGKSNTVGYATGYLVWGGNSGVRVLDEKAPVTPGTEHLPPGYGWPMIWLENAADLPAGSRTVCEAIP